MTVTSVFPTADFEHAPPPDSFVVKGKVGKRSKNKSSPPRKDMTLQKQASITSFDTELSLADTSEDFFGASSSPVPSSHRRWMQNHHHYPSSPMPRLPNLSMLSNHVQPDFDFDNTEGRELQRMLVADAAPPDHKQEKDDVHLLSNEDDGDRDHSPARRGPRSNSRHRRMRSRSHDNSYCARSSAPPRRAVAYDLGQLSINSPNSPTTKKNTNNDNENDDNSITDSMVDRAEIDAMRDQSEGNRHGRYPIMGGGSDDTKSKKTVRSGMVASMTTSRDRYVRTDEEQQQSDQPFERRKSWHGSNSGGGGGGAKKLFALPNRVQPDYGIGAGIQDEHDIEFEDEDLRLDLDSSDDDDNHVKKEAKKEKNRRRTKNRNHQNGYIVDDDDIDENELRAELGLPPKPQYDEAELDLAEEVARNDRSEGPRQLRLFRRRGTEPHATGGRGRGADGDWGLNTVRDYNVRRSIERWIVGGDNHDNPNKQQKKKKKDWGL